VKGAVLAFAAALLSGQAFGQSAVADWFPLRVGDRWIYAHETRDDAGAGKAHLEIHRWETEETIAGWWAVPEGTLVERQVRLREGSLGYRLNTDPAYLIRGDCLYLTDVGWEPRDHQLTPAYREELLAGHIAPDLCFPLGKGKGWGATMYAKDWQVAGTHAGDEFHVTSVSPYLGSGMTADVWFQRRVGVVREEEIHHGTIGETRTRLLRFELGR
jgi:hypothetical protein